MLSQLLRTTFRHLWQRRLYTFISLLSLTVGLTVFCLIVLHVRHELSYNAHWPDANRIHLITHQQGGESAGFALSSAFSSEYIVNITDFIGEFVAGYTEISTLYARVADVEFDQPLAVAFADKSFMDVFAPPVVAGHLATVLEGSRFIAVDTGTAERLFGSAAAAVGKSIILENTRSTHPSPNIVPAQPTEFEVMAVYKLPAPVTRLTQFHVIVAHNDYSARMLPAINGNRDTYITMWLKLAEGIAPETVNTQLDRYLDNYLVHTRDEIDLGGARYSDVLDYKLSALKDLHFSKEINDSPQGDLTRLVTFGAVALLVLLAGCSNVVSLWLAAAMEQRWEIGIRKAVGALPQGIILQGLAEAVALALLALIPTVMLVKQLHPVFANLLSITSMPAPGPVEITVMAGICLCVGLINGLYPALVLARVKPVDVLKPLAVQSRLRRLNLRTLLVAAQFCFSVVLLVVTLGLYLQLSVTRNQPLGFDLENLANVSVNPESLRTRTDIAQVLANELSVVPGIEAVLPVLSAPVLYLPGNGGDQKLVNTQQEVEGTPIHMKAFKPGLFELLRIPLLAGRDLDAVADNMPVSNPRGPEQPVRRIVLNRTAVNELSLRNTDSAIGQKYYLLTDRGAQQFYTPVEVVGVVEDAMLASMRERPGAQAYYFEAFPGLDVLLRYQESVESDISARVNEISRKVTGFPATPVFLEDHTLQMFAEEQRESRLLLLCTGLALFLSCIGLYGLVSIAMKARVKEVGVRKVLGASTISVVCSFLARFSIPVLVATVIAWPVALYAVLQWIERFPYQLDKAWLLPICLGATALVLLVAWATAGVLAFRAASTRPVNSLRYE